MTVTARRFLLGLSVVTCKTPTEILLQNACCSIADINCSPELSEHYTYHGLEGRKLMPLTGLENVLKMIHPSTIFNQINLTSVTSECLDLKSMKLTYYAD